MGRQRVQHERSDLGHCKLMVGGSDHVGSYACTEAEGIREVSVHQTVSEFKFQSSHFPAGCPWARYLTGTSGFSSIKWEQ